MTRNHILGFVLAAAATLIGTLTSVRAQDSLFDRNRRALERAQQRNFDPPHQQQQQGNGRTGYIERGYNNNSGNDSQSQQLDNLDNE